MGSRYVLLYLDVQTGWFWFQ